MKTRMALVVLAGLLLAACSTPRAPVYAPSVPAPGPVPPPPPPPPPNEFAWSVRPGTNGLAGVGVWVRGGRRFSCAGKSVLLTPETPYTRQRMVELYGSDEAAVRTVGEVRARNTGEPKRDYKAYVRPSQCDARGGFGFRDLPDGGWFLILRASSAAGDEVVALQRVHVAGGETRPVRIGQ